MKDFRRLHGWEKSHSFTLDCYQATALFPSHDLGYLADDKHIHLDRKVCEIKKMLSAWMEKISSDRAAADC